MILKPIILLILITTSFLLLLMTSAGASEPTTALGSAFWISFGVFAFCCIHLSRNEKYYKNYIDEDLG